MRFPIARVLVLFGLGVSGYWASSASADEFLISFWCGPPADGNYDAQYAEIAECNFTHAMPSCSGNTPKQNNRILDGTRGLCFVLQRISGFTG